VTDTLLRQFLVNWTMANEAPGRLLGGRGLRRDDLAAGDLGRPAPLYNVATLIAPLFPEGVDEVVGALDDFYGFATEATSGTVFLFSPWPTPDLRPHGWTLIGHEPFMFRPAGGEAPPLPPGLRIEEVRDEASLRAFEIAIARGLPMHEIEEQGPGAAFTAEMLADDRQRFWVGWEEDRPVSAAATFVAAGINDVTLVATVPEARRRGYGAALTWRATLADPALPDDVVKELLPCLDPMLQRLPTADRAALHLTEMDGLTQQELADRLGLSLSGAKSRVQRARQKLKKVFIDCCVIESDRRGGAVEYHPGRERCCGDQCNDCAV
ncbi:MAG: sigma factor-like helix-turn-helix DNA-binding protein, partial [Thermomicrobiales bacterium]